MDKLSGVPRVELHVRGTEVSGLRVMKRAGDHYFGFIPKVLYIVYQYSSDKKKCFLPVFDIVKRLNFVLIMLINRCLRPQRSNSCVESLIIKKTSMRKNSVV